MTHCPLLFCQPSLLIKNPHIISYLMTPEKPYKLKLSNARQIVCITTTNQ